MKAVVWSGLRLAILGLGVLIGSAGGASALSLFDLQQPGAFFDTPDGKLRFENFDTRGQIAGMELDDEDLMNFEVQVLDDGFRLIGSIGVADGFDGDVVLSYSVSTPMGGLVEKASGFFNGTATGPGALADVTETFTLPPDAPPEVLLGAFQLTATGDPGSPDVLLAMAEFTQPAAEFMVLKDILVSARAETAVSASISIIDQRYELPEPSTAMLLGGALALCGIGTPTGRRR